MAILKWSTLRLHVAWAREHSKHMEITVATVEMSSGDETQAPEQQEVTEHTKSWSCGRPHARSRPR